MSGGWEPKHKIRPLLAEMDFKHSRLARPSETREHSSNPGRIPALSSLVATGGYPNLFKLKNSGPPLTLGTPVGLGATCVAATTLASTARQHCHQHGRPRGRSSTFLKPAGCWRWSLLAPSHPSYPHPRQHLYPSGNRNSPPRRRGCPCT